MTESVSNDSLISTSAYQDGKGRTVFASDKGYAACRKTLRDGKTILEEYLDEAGAPVMLPAGYSAIRRVYEDGLNTEIQYLDDTGAPAVLPSGYDTIRRTYNEIQLADTDTYFAGGIQVQRTQGYWSLHRIYGSGQDRKRVVRQEYRGEDGSLAINTSGYACWVRTYDPEGRITSEKYYGVSGEPAKRSGGYFGYQREYDAEGRTLRTTYLDAEGNAANITRGYATIRKEYEPGGTKTLYYNAAGEPVTAGNSQYGTLTTEQGTSYLNEDGEVMFRLDHLLYSNQTAVLVLGAAAIVLALLARGRMRIALLLACALFILYMTMGWREAGSRRIHPELFQRYRQFFLSASTRQEIMNNVFLFVPFGTALQSVLHSRKRIRSGWRAMMVTTLICILFSAGIETVQLIARIGWFEFDDMVSNGLGGLTGAAICLFFHPDGRKKGTARIIHKHIGD